MFDKSLHILSYIRFLRGSKKMEIVDKVDKKRKGSMEDIYNKEMTGKGKEKDRKKKTPVT